MSVWKRQDNGRWKLVMDLGIESPDDETCGPSVRLDPAELPEPSGGRVGRANRPALLDTRARLFAGLVAERRESARPMPLRVGPETRLYRDGSCPAEGFEAVKRLLTVHPAARTALGAHDRRWSPNRATWPTPTASTSRRAPPRTMNRSKPATTCTCGTGTTSGSWRLEVDVTSPIPPDDAAVEDACAGTVA